MAIKTVFSHQRRIKTKTGAIRRIMVKTHIRKTNKGRKIRKH